MTMTNQEINERVAKLCGWKRIETGFGSQWAEMGGKLAPPDYYHSLDACATFETSIETQDYIHQLHMIMPICKLTLAADPSLWILAYLKTAPPQRCEAFLRMKGQWE